MTEYILKLFVHVKVYVRHCTIVNDVLLISPIIILIRMLVFLVRKRASRVKDDHELQSLRLALYHRNRSHGSVAKRKRGNLKILIMLKQTKLRWTIQVGLKIA